MTQHQYLRVYDESLVRKIVLSRTDKHNALNPDMLEQLTAAVQEAAEEKEISILLFISEGKHFCSGADLAWMKKSAYMSQKDNLADAKRLFEFYETLYNCPKIIVSSVHGAAMGGGLGIVACSDIVLADPSARFALSEVKLGLIPATIAPFVFSKLGASNYQYLATSAKVFDGKAAKDYGLVHELIPAKSNRLEFTDSYIDQICQNAPQAMIHHKQLLRQLLLADPANLKESTSKAIATRRVSGEGQEGLLAFLEKRKPVWSHS